MAARKEISTVNKILILQALVVSILTVGFILFASVQKAISPGLGGLVALVPNIYLASRVHVASGKSAKHILRAFYSAEVKKIFLTVALFCIVFQFPGINLLTLLLGFVAVLSVHWFALILWRDFNY